MEYQIKLNKKYTPALHCILSFEGTSYKKLQDGAISFFTSCCFTSALPSANIVYYKFLELDSSFSEKDFCLELSFFN